MTYKQEKIKELTIKSMKAKNIIVASEIARLWKLVDQDAPKAEIVEKIEFLEEFIDEISIIV